MSLSWLLGNSFQSNYEEKMRSPLKKTESAEGWTSWMYEHPPYGVMIQWWREGWDSPETGYAGDISPYANVSGLYWRLTGIGRETK